MRIFEFKPGDVITRIEPCHVVQEKFNDNLGLKSEHTYLTFDFIGQPLTLNSIANACINLTRAGFPVHLPICEGFPADWTEGWEKYEEIPVFEKGSAKEEKLPIEKEDRNIFLIASVLFALGAFGFVYAAYENKPTVDLIRVAGMYSVVCAIYCFRKWWKGGDGL